MTIPQHPAFLFDLDGTLVDSVYEHVLAWHKALEAASIDLQVWRIMLADLVTDADLLQP
jgi:beta-phosphoglucomutase-like phosphatase (HAD superfamily)